MPKPERAAAPIFAVIDAPGKTIKDKGYLWIEVGSCQAVPGGRQIRGQPHTCTRSVWQRHRAPCNAFTACRRQLLDCSSRACARAQAWPGCKGCNGAVLKPSGSADAVRLRQLRVLPALATRIAQIPLSDIFKLDVSQMKSMDDYTKLLSKKGRWNFKDRQKK